MADLKDRLDDNCAGRFYTTDDCIDCGLCSQMAPNHFKTHEKEHWAYVYEQPKDDEGVELCLEAKEQCPTDAIGDDGE